MKLGKIIEKIAKNVKDAENIEITGIAYDSRAVKPGFLFVAIKGFETDGHKYIDSAVKNAVTVHDCNLSVSATEPTVNAVCPAIRILHLSSLVHGIAEVPVVQEVLSRFHLQGLVDCAPLFCSVDRNVD